MAELTTAEIEQITDELVSLRKKIQETGDSLEPDARVERAVQGDRPAQQEAERRYESEKDRTRERGKG